MISMKFMIQDEINFGKFFQNIYEEGSFGVEELEQNRYCNMVEMNELPEYSKDKSVIRILQHRTWPLMDVNENGSFLRRKFTEHYENTVVKKQKKGQKIGVKLDGEDFDRLAVSSFSRKRDEKKEM